MNATTDQNNRGGADSARERFPLARILIRRRFQLIACLLLVSSIAFVATTMRHPRYEATAQVQVVMDKPQIGALSGGAHSLSGDYFNTQCQLLKSRHVLSLAAQKLRAQDSGQIPQSTASALDSYGSLRDSVKVLPVSGSRLIDIVGVSDQPTMAAAIANQVTSAFIEISRDARMAANNRLVEQMQQQLADYDQEIQEKEEEINRFRQENLITGSNTTLTAVESRINSLERDMTQTQMKRLELQAKRDKLVRMLTKGQGLGEHELSLTEIDNHRDIVGLKQNLSRMQQDMVALEQAYLPSHPRLRDLRVQMAALQTKLLDQKHNLMQSLMEDVTEQYRETVKHEESLVTLLNEQKAVGVELTVQNQRYFNLLNELSDIQQFRNSCATQLREFQLQEEMQESPVVVVDAAHTPLEPAGLSKSHQAASILLLGLLFSIVFVFAMDRMSQAPDEDGRQNEMAYYGQMPAGAWAVPWWAQQPAAATQASVESAEQTIHAAPDEQPVAQAQTEPMRFKTQERAEVKLGQLENIDLGKSNYDDLAFAARCRIVQADQASAEAAMFREMGTHLMQRFGRTHQALVVTSPQPRQGKTTCATNLAMVFARAGRRVLLIDANWESPALHKVFPGSVGKPSLHDVIFDRNAMDQALRDPDLATLAVLPNESQSSYSREEDGAAIARLLQELKSEFDWILFDAGPMRQATCKDLLQTVGRCLCVAQSSQESEQRALQEQIELCGAVCIGVVENSHHPSSVDQRSSAKQPV